MGRVLLPLAVVIVSLAGCGAGSARTPAFPPAAGKAARGVCGTVRTPSGFKHLVWIWMENHSYGDIIDNTSVAPYINLLARRCGLATNHHNLTHLSLPNYIGVTSG